ncbi:hypothetical protein FA95DRAFT_605034 [Auriscalpium vulgare]|uniref:Uncharacterized protein n=1 Tax=Auriscalpium vulgare TaxID=40419 RepID=A0ACB8S3Q1_9AGAM|nr:hypothetical protein FA95DRAFT_605034 [Auriscalpium vulgare]
MVIKCNRGTMTWQTMRSGGRTEAMTSIFTVKSSTGHGLLRGIWACQTMYDFLSVVSQGRLPPSLLKDADALAKDFCTYGPDLPRVPCDTDMYRMQCLLIRRCRIYMRGSRLPTVLTTTYTAYRRFDSRRTYLAPHVT